jgi:hypothetical protein
MHMVVHGEPVILMQPVITDLALHSLVDCRSNTVNDYCSVACTCQLGDSGHRASREDPDPLQLHPQNHIHNPTMLFMDGCVRGVACPDFCN